MRFIILLCCVLFANVKSAQINFSNLKTVVNKAQESIFTESLEDALTLEQKLELHKKRYFARY